MAEFIIAFNLTNHTEAGYANDPRDAGGETYGGVTRKDFPNAKIWSIVDKYKPLKEGQIINDAEVTPALQSFFKTEFWDMLDLDTETNQLLANQIYDMAVNAGVAEGKKLYNEIRADLNNFSDN